MNLPGDVPKPITSNGCVYVEGVESRDMCRANGPLCRTQYTNITIALLTQDFVLGPLQVKQPQEHRFAQSYSNNVSSNLV